MPPIIYIVLLTTLFTALHAADMSISQQLRQCENHFQANRLTTGKGGTALVCYEAVLKTDPTNAQAWAGLDKIEACYRDWINNAQTGGQPNKVKRYQARLRKVAAVKARLQPPQSQPRLKTTPPTTPPILQIDPGGHQSLITGVAFTPDGRYLVSAGMDKLIHVWNLDTGKTVRTLRGQISAGPEGQIYAMALSPDGRWLAAGGWMRVYGEMPIRLYDFASGKIVALLKGHTDAVFSLAFSPDSRFLVSGSADTNAIIWDLESKAEALGGSKLSGHLAFSPDSRFLVSGSADTNAIIWDLESKASALGGSKLSGHTDDIYAVAFTPDSKRVVTGSDDYTLRLWQVRNGEQIATLTGHTDKVYAVAVASDLRGFGNLEGLNQRDGLIASGSDDYTIRLWHGRTGRFIKTLANQGTQVGSLSFSPDGRYLVSGIVKGPNNHCHVWSIPDGKEIVTYRGHNSIVLATAVSPDGRTVATGGGDNHEIHLWTLRDGRLQKRLSGVGASIWAVGFSADGRTLAWGNTNVGSSNAQREPFEYTITLPSKAEALDSRPASKAEALDSRPSKAEALDSRALDSRQFLGAPRKMVSQPSHFSRAQDKWRNWTLRTRQGGNYGYQAILEIRHQNRLKASIERGSTDGYSHISYTFTPDGQRIISGGSNGVLTAYNRNGNKLGDYVGHTSDVWAVAVSPDGRLLVSGSFDQTVRLWDVQSRENLLSLFHGSDGEWVAWTPSGHYVSSPNGDKMVGWQINRGADNAADYVSATQLRDHFYHPDIIANAIRLHSVQRAIAEAGGPTFRVELLNTELPPKFYIKAPPNPHSTLTGQVNVVLRFVASEIPLETIQAYVNDGLVDNLKKWSRSQRPGYEKTLRLPLRRGKNDIRIVAKNRVGAAEQRLQVEFESRHPDKQGTLYLIAVGVSQYQDKARSLRFAAKDAHDIHKLLTAQQGKRYQAVESRLLADDATPPTAANIKDALKLFEQATAQDTVVLFLSGHGDSADQDYYFLPHDAQEQGNSWQPDTVIKWRELQNVMENVKGQRVLLVDTCYAGGAFNPRLLKDASDNSIIVISATDEHSVAEELAELGHGVFTYALLKGLQGKADLVGDEQVITLKELDTYLVFAIEEITGGSQIPATNVQAGFQDFGFVRLK